jgi:hypothetical protein
MLDSRKIKTAINTISEDERGYHRSGQIMVLSGLITRQWIANQDSQLQEYERILLNIDYDLWDIEAVAYKLDSFKFLWESGGLTDGEWRMFAASDIDLFHFSIRSAFDSIAKLIVKASGSPGQAPKDSFNALRKWILKYPDRRTKFGEDLAEVILACEWFDPLRDIRDDIVHESAKNLTFQEPGKILFMLLPPHNAHHFIREVMFNENVVDFELYAGFYYGYLISFLEEVASIIIERLRLSGPEILTRTSHSGLRVLLEWMNRLIGMQ